MDRDATSEPFRKALTALIKRLGQPEVVRALGVDTSTVSKWKSGERWPEPGMVLRICEALHVSPDQLYGFKPLPASTERTADLQRVAALLAAAQAALSDHVVPGDGLDEAKANVFAALEASEGKRKRRKRGGAGA